MADGDTNKWEKPEGEPLFVAISRDNADFKGAYARAKETFPRFLAAIRTDDYSLANGTTNAVKLRLKDRELSEKLGEDQWVFLWVYDIQADGSGYSGEVYELPKVSINGLAIGDRISFTDGVYDWMIIRNGHLWGGLTIRLVRAMQPEDQRANFDDYSGISVYEENLP